MLASIPELVNRPGNRRGRDNRTRFSAWTEVPSGMIPISEVLQRLVVATVLGAIVGIERERLERAAGLRTHALVGVGAALFMLVSIYGFNDVMSWPGVSLDPSRVAAQVVSGIGFLGAGTIIFQREIVRGLTTAASIWTVAAIGLAVGGGLYLPAVATTLLALLILAGLKPIEERLFIRRRSRVIRLVVGPQTGALAAIREAADAVGIRVERMIVEPGSETEGDQVDLTVSRESSTTIDAFIDRLRQIAGVQRITSVRLPGPLDVTSDLDDETLDRN